MKLRNKRTGEIYDFKITPDYDDAMSGWKIENKDFGVRYYSHLAELNEEWCDYEEPKGNWTIDPMNENYIDDGRYTAPDELERYEELGLKFNTREEAEKAVEKLKAWKRLKDKGFRFTGCSLPSDKGMCICYETDIETWSMQDLQDFKTLFGGEE